MRTLSSLIDAAWSHEERDVLYSGLLLYPGSVPHTHHEDNDTLPQCCLVHFLLILYKDSKFISIVYETTVMQSVFSTPRLSTSFAYYGLAMDLDKFGVDIYLIQVIFGAVDIPAKVVVNVSMSLFGRRRSQCAVLVFAGITILLNLLVPYGMLAHCYPSFAQHIW